MVTKVMTHEQMVAKMLKNPIVLAEHERINHGWIFVRPLWRGFAVAPPVTAFVYLAILILLRVSGVVDYQGPPDEEDYIREPAVIAMCFVFMSITTLVNALLCGLPLIYILKKCGRLSSLSLMLGATILGAVALSIEIALSVVLLNGNVSNWGSALTWTIAVGAAAGCFAALVFRMVVGIKNGNTVQQETAQ